MHSHPNPHPNHSHPKKPYTQNCSICCEPKQRGTLQIDHLRLPDICYQCWYSHIKNYISRINYRVGDTLLSPFSQGNPLDVVDCLNSLKKEHGIQIQEMLFRKYSAFNKDIDKCPSQSCDFVYIGEKCKWGSKENIYNCPKCQMPLTANNSYTFKSLMASFYLIMANKCPKCDIPIEKISGCPHMTCPCGHHFCWYCYKDHPSGTLKRVYPLHTIPQCAFIFLSKIVLFLICCVNLLITFNGNWIIKSLFSLLAVVFSVVWRAVAMDGFILLQVMYFIMLKRKRNFYNSMSKTRNTIILAVLINLAALGALYMLDQLIFFGEILLGEFLLAVLGFGIGYGVIYSVETWFQFVA